jgi:TonB family protein
MNLTPVSRRAGLTLALSLLLAAPLAAQNVLFTDYNDKFLPVVRARGNRAYVVVDGKYVVADGRRFALQKTAEYLPFFVAVRDLEVKTHHLEVSGSELNHDFIFRARLESPFYLDDVFIVLELNSENIGKVIFLQEVGNLEARESKTVSVTVPLSSGLGEGKYQFHLFAGGREVLHSNIPPMQRDHVLDQMTLRRIADVQDAPPKPFIGPGPEYPSALLKTKTTGQVVVSLRIGANGQVYDPKVKSASDPAFGEAALVAVRLWRFLPQVRHGRPVETFVDLPFDFKPPEKPAKKS